MEKRYMMKEAKLPMPQNFSVGSPKKQSASLVISEWHLVATSEFS
jgi:hypothetical protein